DDAGIGVGEKDGNGFLTACQPGKSAAQNEAAGNDAAEGERVSFYVLQNFSPAAMDGSCIDERMKQVLIDIAGPEDHIGHDVIEFLRKMRAQLAAFQMRRRE